MWSVTGLHERLCAPGFLEEAARFTTRGKRRRHDVAWCLFRFESVIRQLRRSLLLGNYQPDGFDLLFIRDPKPRVIARAPIEDRIVHAGVALLLQPILAQSLRPEAYANRPRSCASCRSFGNTATSSISTSRATFPASTSTSCAICWRGACAIGASSS
jgi:hypothetical protein